MPSPATLAYWGGLGLIVSLFALVFWRMLTGEINLDSLLDGDRLDPSDPSGYATSFSPGRGQLFMVTIFVAGYYLLQVIHDPKVFPQIPTTWLVALGGSQAMYLGGKAKSMLVGSLQERLRDLFNRRTP